MKGKRRKIGHRRCTEEKQPPRATSTENPYQITSRDIMKSEDCIWRLKDTTHAITLRQVLLHADTFSLHARYFFPLHFIKSLLQKKKNFN
jgi:hypothetical protein